MEDHHISLLEEISDKTCARFNGQSSEEAGGAGSLDTAVQDVRGLRFDEDVLKCLEQELMRLAQAWPGSDDTAACASKQ